MYDVWAHRAVAHSSPETYRTRCDMCSELTCKLDDRSRLHPWSYYCDALKKSLTIDEVRGMTKRECPRHRDIRRLARK